MKKKGSLMRNWIAVAAVLFGALFCVGLSVAGPPQGQAPHDPQVINAQGYEKIVQEHHGKPLLMTFWATWCEPCRDEYPMLNELAKEYGSKGLQVVGVNFDQEGDLILMRRFIARYKPVFPNYRKEQGHEAEFNQTVLPGWNGALPASFFYDKDGKQVGHVVGASNRETYEAAIRQLLTGGSPTASR
jgi:thiol-disulfide isomerase/thioredoxin